MELVAAGFDYTHRMVENIHFMEHYWSKPDEQPAKKVLANWEAVQKILDAHPYALNTGPLRPSTPRMAGLHPEHPAQIAFTRVDAPKHVHNRRWRMRKGSVPPNPFGKIDRVKTNPPASSLDLVEPAGPVDPAVSIIAVREPDGRLSSVYCAYSLHYVGGSGVGGSGVGGSGRAHVSADYFGMFCEAL